jgi:hypothetical protein
MVADALLKPHNSYSPPNTISNQKKEKRIEGDGNVECIERYKCR